MTGVATAIAGAAIVGGVVSNNASKRATKSQENANAQASAQLEKATAAAKNDLFKLFPAAQQNMQQGYQGALDVFKNTLPQQANTFQAGNVAAQNQLLAGMPQFQNAILGAPVDYSKFQATQLQQPNFDFANQKLQYVDPYAPAPAGPPLTNHPQYGQITQGNSYGPLSNGGYGSSGNAGTTAGQFQFGLNDKGMDYSRLLGGFS